MDLLRLALGMGGRKPLLHALRLSDYLDPARGPRTSRITSAISMRAGRCASGRSTFSCSSSATPCRSGFWATRWPTRRTGNAGGLHALPAESAPHRAPRHAGPHLVAGHRGAVLLRLGAGCPFLPRPPQLASAGDSRRHGRSLTASFASAMPIGSTLPIPSSIWTESPSAAWSP